MIEDDGTIDRQAREGQGSPMGGDDHVRSEVHQPVVDRPVVPGAAAGAPAGVAEAAAALPQSAAAVSCTVL